MKLYLVQHGEATSKDINPERPLTEKGHDDIRKLSQFPPMSTYLSSEIQLDQVIHSGKLRAKETAEYFVKMLTTPSSLVVNDNINPNDSLEPLIQQIQSYKSDTLIVGHLPYLSKLTSSLLADNETSVNLSFQPGTCICLETDEDRNWKLNWMIRPELLAD